MSKWTVVLNQRQGRRLSPDRRLQAHVLLRRAPHVWLVLLVSIRQIRKNLKPLDRLQEGARQLAHGQLDTRVNVTSRDEFEELAVSFNQWRASSAGSSTPSRCGGRSGPLEREQAPRRDASGLRRPARAPPGPRTGRHLDRRRRRGRARAAGEHGDPGRRAAAVVPRWSRSAWKHSPGPARPYATNTRAGPRLCDADRAAREGLVAFVAHPLMVDERLDRAWPLRTHATVDGLDLSGVRRCRRRHRPVRRRQARGRGACRTARCSCGSSRRWRRWGGSPGGSRTTSTIC